MGRYSHKVKTQLDFQKYINVGDTKVYDTELIFSKVKGLQTSSCEVDLMAPLSYELSQAPTAMFTETGKMRVAKAKSNLKKVLQKEVSARFIERQITTLVIDGCAVFYVLSWPSYTGTVGDLVVAYREYIGKRLKTYDIYLVFDRYREFSTKSVTRASRGARTSRVHQLTTAMPTPPQKVVLTDLANKRQLKAKIMEYLCENVSFPEGANINRRRVVTGEDPVPMELTKATKIRRQDMKITHEEAENILEQQMVISASQPINCVFVVSDDTDVFVLLLYFYAKYNLTGFVIMLSAVKDRATIDIKSTVSANKDIILDLPAAHALS